MGELELMGMNSNIPVEDNCYKSIGAVGYKIPVIRCDHVNVYTNRLTDPILILRLHGQERDMIYSEYL